MADLFGEPDLPAALISRCLLGVPCRYHGRKVTRYGMPIGRKKLVEQLRKRYRLIAVCPEVDGGLAVPRPPTRIIEGRWMCGGEDVTKAFRKGSEYALLLAQKAGAKRAYLLAGSPACDREYGMCGRLLQEKGVRVYSVGGKTAPTSALVR